MDWFLYDRDLRHERAKVAKVIFNSSGAPHEISKLSVNMAAKRFSSQNFYATVIFYLFLPFKWLIRDEINSKFNNSKVDNQMNTVHSSNVQSFLYQVSPFPLNSEK